MSPDRPAAERALAHPSRVTSFGRTGGGLGGVLRGATAPEVARYVVEPPPDGPLTFPDGWELDPGARFGRDAPLVVEVGSGRGHQILAHALAHPDVDHVAFEVWSDGVAHTAAGAARAGLTNLAILRTDAARDFTRVLPAHAASEVWTFFPDPWPKARHRKRRLVTDRFAAEVARVLRPGGAWRLATDWDDYAEQIRAVVVASPDFAPDPAATDGFSPRWDGRVLTPFERKGRAAGREVRDVVAFRR